MEPSKLVKVLDHGFVRLVDSMGSDLSIVRAARVSYNAAWRAGEDTGSDARLIKRLMTDHHTSPFEAVEFQFEIKCPIFVARQWHRHRTWSYNELSARYRELPSEYYLPSLDVIGKQSTANKQGREAADPDPVMQEAYDTACVTAFAVYKDLLANGWPRELARAVLPVATYTHFFAKVNLRNLLHFLELRLDPHAQWEIRQYAEALKTLAAEVVPVAMGAWNDSR